MLSENIKAYISAIGTCIVKDIVGMHDNNAGYVIEKFVQSLNPISIVGKSNFYQRCINLDLDKQVFGFFGGQGKGLFINRFWLHEKFSF